MKRWYSPLMTAAFLLAMGVRGYMVWLGYPERTAVMVTSSLDNTGAVA